jgi:CheY-like chemotaxis protein
MTKIVVCEDDPVILKAIGVILRSGGFEIHAASDGLAGLELIERERPDVILTDVAMPGLSGLELADAVRGRAHLAHIPIILVTASAQRSELEEGLRHGAAGYIVKPFRPADLRMKLQDVLAGGEGHGER